MKEFHEIKNLRFEGGYLIVDIDGRERTFSLKDISPALEKASEEERSAYEVSPSGYGIHWPLIDEDLSIDGLLGIAHYPAMKRQTA